jgi:anti-sigma B factor antagonist
VTEAARITFEGAEDVLLARITGEIDLSNAPDLEETIVQAVANTALGMVVDLSAVEYVDSAGVRMLAHLVERFRWRKQFLRAVAPDGSRVRGVLAMAGVEDVIPVDTTASEAWERILEANAEAAEEGPDVTAGGKEPGG